MFEKITTKIITDVKETAKKEINTTIDAQIPFIIGAITIGVTILSLKSSSKIKKSEQTTITINNYIL